MQTNQPAAPTAPIPTAFTIAPRGYSFHGGQLQKNELGSLTPQEPYSLREQRLINALQAIVREAMDYPPVRPHDSFSSLPAHLVESAQRALGAYGAKVPQTGVAV